jgi:hypothetical protein
LLDDHAVFRLIADHRTLVRGSYNDSTIPFEEGQSDNRPVARIAMTSHVAKKNINSMAQESLKAQGNDISYLRWAGSLLRTS